MSGEVGPGFLRPRCRLVYFYLFLFVCLVWFAMRVAQDKGT